MYIIFYLFNVYPPPLGVNDEHNAIFVFAFFLYSENLEDNRDASKSIWGSYLISKKKKKGTRMNNRFKNLCNYYSVKKRLNSEIISRKKHLDTHTHK